MPLCILKSSQQVPAEPGSGQKSRQAIYHMICLLRGKAFEDLTAPSIDRRISVVRAESRRDWRYGRTSEPLPRHRRPNTETSWPYN